MVGYVAIGFLWHILNMVSTGLYILEQRKDWWTGKHFQANGLGQVDGLFRNYPVKTEEFYEEPQ
jgi:hypothetical protein